ITSVTVQKPCNPLKNRSCFTRTCSPLDKEKIVFCVPNNFVLGSLNRCNNTLHLSAGMGAQSFQKHLITDLLISIKDRYNRPIINLKLTFEGHINFLSTNRSLVTNLP